MGSNDRNVFFAARAFRHDAGLTPEQRADPFAIAELRGIEVVVAPLGADEPVEGAFLRRDGHDFILVNGSKAGRRGRFTAAHELGHSALLQDAGDIEVVDTSTDLDVAGDVREREANLFADELLMPLAGLQGMIETGMPIEDAVGLVCRNYDVSPASATIRLRIAGIIEAEAAAAVRRVIDDDWRRFWREQEIPPDSRSTTELLLPKRFVMRAEKLLAAGVISEERFAELIERDPIASQ